MHRQPEITMPSPLTADGRSRCIKTNIKKFAKKLTLHARNIKHTGKQLLVEPISLWHIQQNF